MSVTARQGPGTKVFNHSGKKEKAEVQYNITHKTTCFGGVLRYGTGDAEANNFAIEDDYNYNCRMSQLEKSKERVSISVPRQGTWMEGCDALN